MFSRFSVVVINSHPYIEGLGIVVINSVLIFGTESGQFYVNQSFKTTKIFFARAFGARDHLYDDFEGRCAKKHTFVSKHDW